MIRLLIAILLIFINLPCLASQGLYPVPMVYQSSTGSSVTVGTTSVPPAARSLDYTTGSYGFKVLGLPTHSGNLQSISVYVMDSNAVAGFRLSLYAHDAVNNMPSTQIANSVSNEGTMTDTMTLHTLDVPGSPGITAGAQYWIVLEQTANYNSIGSTAWQANADYRQSNKVNAGAYDWPDWDGVQDSSNLNYEISAYFTLAW